MYLPAEAAKIHSFFTSMTEFSVLAFRSIFFLVDPFAAVPPFLAMTDQADTAAVL